MLPRGTDSWHHERTYFSFPPIVFYHLGQVLLSMEYTLLLSLLPSDQFTWNHDIFTNLSHNALSSDRSSHLGPTNEIYLRCSAGSEPRAFGLRTCVTH